MNKNGLIQSFRCCSGPVLFLVGVCVTIGSLFLWVGSGAGWIFIVVAGTALAAFSLLGARRGCRAEIGTRRLVPRAG